MATRDPIFPLSVTAFDAWLATQTEDSAYEFIGGEVYPVSSSQWAATLTAVMTYYLLDFVLKHNLGRVTSAEGGYIVADERYMPDVAFVSHAKPLVNVAYAPYAPDLAVEVVSPSDSPKKIATKVGNYGYAGVLLWVVYPEARTIAVHESGQPVRLLGMRDHLDGGRVLTGFSVAVSAIFSVLGD